MNWWQRLRAMPDKERALLIARLASGVIIGLLYALGGLGLYLRAHYPSPNASPSGVVPTTPAAVSNAIPAEQTPVPTLFPTITLGPTVALATEEPTAVPTELATAIPESVPTETLVPTLTVSPTTVPPDTPTSAEPTMTAAPAATETLAPLGPPPTRANP